MIDQGQQHQGREGGGGGGGGGAGPGGRGGRGKRKSGKNSRFMQKAKKFGKQGKLGRGFEVDGETYNYFLGVLQLWQKNEFEGEEERGDFVNNSLEQGIGHEVDYSSNQMTSRVIETILPFGRDEVVLRFAQAFTPSLRTVCMDPFASHVLEKLLEITSLEEDEEESLGEWFRQTAKFVINNLEEFAFDKYANHILRKVCECLVGRVMKSGQPAVQQQGPKSKTTQQQNDKLYKEREQVPKNLQIYADFYQRFLAWPQFFDMFKSELTCGLVQTVLTTCSKVDTSIAEVNVEDGVKKVLKALGDEVDLANETHKLHLYMLEACLSLSTSMWDKIYNKYFEGKLRSFGVHSLGNFSVKKVVESCPSKIKFESVFDEIQPNLPDIYAAGSYSIFSSLAEVCKKFQTRQAQFLQSLNAVLGYEGSEKKDAGKENFIMNVARFGGKIELKEDGTTPKYLTQLAGALILQNIMEFHKPQRVITAMLDLEGSNLSKLSMDGKGSHIIESFFTSGAVGEKNKEKLLHRMKEYLVSLSLNKFGSRVINALWAWANLKHKTLIASALSERVSQLNANQFGKFISESCALHSYKRDPKTWAEAIEKVDKRKGEAEKFLSEVLSDEKPEKIKNETDEEGLPKNEDETQTPKKNKKKKKKHVEEIHDAQEEQESIQDDELESDSSTKKNKKNKRKHTALIEDEASPPEVTTAESEPSKKKKKKRNKHLTTE